jgi:hypothetical protein
MGKHKCRSYLVSNSVHATAPDRLCGLTVGVPDYRSTGPGFDSRRYHIFVVVVSVERGSLSLVRITEELNIGSGRKKIY